MARSSRIALPEAAAASRARDASVLAQLRALLESGTASRELLSLEPLLDEYDGAEVAAAALKLLEQERLAERARAAAQERAAASERPAHAPPPRAHAGPMVSLFASVGARESVRPADLVGDDHEQSRRRRDRRGANRDSRIALDDRGGERARRSDHRSRIRHGGERSSRAPAPRRGTSAPGRPARPSRPRRAPAGAKAGPSRGRAAATNGRPREARGGGFRPRDRHDDRPRRDRDSDDRPPRGPRGPRPSPRA